MNKILFYFCLLFSLSLNVYADDYTQIIKDKNINIYLQKPAKFDYTKELSNDLQKISFLISQFKTLNITINLHNKQTISYSNLNPQSCEIGINYNLNQWNKTGDIFNSFYDELLFNTLHEIGHCYLSRDALLNDIQWIIPISQEKKNHINKIIDESSNHIVRSCPTCSKEIIFKKTPLKIVYHEMYADTFASYFLINLYNIDINPLINFRKNVFLKNNNSLYPTHFSIENIKIDKNNLQNPSNILEYNQKGFLLYLNKMEKI